MSAGVRFWTDRSAIRQIYAVAAGASAAVAVSRWIPIVKDYGVQPTRAPDGRAIYYFFLRDWSYCA